ncbi:MAG: M1 family metallopeptidase [Saprospiraceae bacterium]|nr:M1 family metallopeptidase [Lewinella sp.]
MRKTLLVSLTLLALSTAYSQPDFYNKYTFTEADTLRGMLRPERTCYDVTFYDINIRVDPKQRTLNGYVDIMYQAITDFTRLQIDLYRNMELDSITMDGRILSFERKFDAVFVDFPQQKAGSSGSFRAYYHGQPTAARNPPWDGGFVWRVDQKGRYWVGVACEGDGASLWWPNKDHLSDEPDSVSIRVSVPKGLTCVANGNLRGTVDEGDFQRWDWFVSYPINNYDVSVNIAHYAHFSDTYTAADGAELDLDYYVLDYNKSRAMEHFEQVKPMLKCYEQYFGKYPFWRDGYAMVETPYLGMEHQGAIAYGNRYMRGYLGGMIPSDMDWDYIIIHETGHEYFGNSISCNDLAEMWIHESFTTYMEALYVECMYGYEDAIRYLVGQRSFIDNEQPVIGPKNVNWEDWDGSDHYYKGAWMLHTLRNAIQDDGLWFDILKSFYQEHAISNVTTEDFVQWVNQKTGKDWGAFFEQYLMYTDLPVLEYHLAEKGNDLEVRYRWKSDVSSFDMPILLGKKGALQLVHPKNDEWQSMLLKNTSPGSFDVDLERFLVKTRKVAAR